MKSQRRPIIRKTRQWVAPGPNSAQKVLIRQPENISRELPIKLEYRHHHVIYHSIIILVYVYARKLYRLHKSSILDTHTSWVLDIIPMLVWIRRSKWIFRIAVLMEAITLKRKFLNLPAGAVLCIYSENSSEDGYSIPAEWRNFMTPHVSCLFDKIIFRCYSNVSSR